MVSSQNVELDLVRDDRTLPSPTPTPTPLSPTTPVLTDGGTFGSGPDTLVVTLSEDAYKGDAQASVSLDGALLTATPLTVTASHEAGAGEIFTFKGAFGAGAHDLRIAFLNDAYDGTPSTDRNLYVTGVNYDGLLPNGAVAATLYSAGKTGYTIPPANDPEASHATPPTPTPDPAPAMMANGVLSNPDFNAAGFAGVQTFSGELAAGAVPALYSPSTTHF